MLRWREEEETLVYFDVLQVDHLRRRTGNLYDRSDNLSGSAGERVKDTKLSNLTDSLMPRTIYSDPKLSI